MTPHRSRATLCLAWGIVAFCCLIGAPDEARPAAAPPGKVEQLIGLLDDPDVQAWLAKQKQISPAKASEQEEVADQISTMESYVRARITGMVEAVPRLPLEIRRA